MTVYYTRGGTMAGQKMPSFSTLICDGPDCGTTPRRGDNARLLRKVARELNWTRVNGKDFCPMHTCEHGYVPGDHHYDAGTCGPRSDLIAVRKGGAA